MRLIAIMNYAFIKQQLFANFAKIANKVDEPHLTVHKGIFSVINIAIQVLESIITCRPKTQKDKQLFFDQTKSVWQAYVLRYKQSIFHLTEIITVWLMWNLYHGT